MRTISKLNSNASPGCKVDSSSSAHSVYSVQLLMDRQIAHGRRTVTVVGHLINRIDNANEQQQQKQQFNNPSREYQTDTGMAMIMEKL